MRGAGLVRQHLYLYAGNLGFEFGGRCKGEEGKKGEFDRTFLSCVTYIRVGSNLTLANATQLSTVWRRTESWSSLASSKNASSSCVAASSGSTLLCVGGGAAVDRRQGVFDPGLSIIRSSRCMGLI